MKASTVVAAIAMVAAFSVAPFTFAEDTVDTTSKPLRADGQKSISDRAESRSTYMKRAGQRYDRMNKKMNGKMTSVDMRRMEREEIDASNSR